MTETRVIANHILLRGDTKVALHGDAGFLAPAAGVAVYFVAGVARETRRDRNAEEKM